MSRALYRRTAVLIHNVLVDQDTPQPTKAVVADLAKGLADAFKEDNAAFRYDRFFPACGLDNWGELKPSPVHRMGSQR